MPIPFLDEAISYGKVGGSIIAAARRWWKARKRRLTPQEKLELRVKWKPQFETWIAEHYREQLRQDCIIRDMKRMDHYPQIAEGKGISSWFRVELIDTYERGIMVGLGLYGLIEEAHGWRRGEYETEKDKMKNCTLAGFIPYENIETVDWDGDQYYSYPHIYCYFTFKGEPYERLAYCEERKLNTHTYHTEVADYYAVRKLSKKKEGWTRWWRRAASV